MTRSTPTTARATMVAARLIGASSLTAFAAFLFAGPPRLVHLAGSAREALVIDLALCLAFFVQHSGMVRRSARAWLSRRIPPHLVPALYTVVSGLVLLAVLVLWQPTGPLIVAIEGPGRWVLRAVFFAALAGFGWSVRALGSFDGFGLRPIKAHLEGRPVRELPLTIRGPYRWVRHPLYTLVLVLMWASPDLTADRLLLNATWTVWVVVGAVLEERDLVHAFGTDYRQYQEEVPMLLPLRRPRRRNPETR